MFWKRSTRKHCSDELLLGHLDGELSLRQDAMVRSHLKACWECRGRVVELEEQAQLVVNVLANPNFPGAERVAQARYKFRAWERRFEREFESGPRLSALASSSLPLRAATVFSLLVAGIVLFLQVRNLSAAEALAATRKLERDFYQTPLPLHQSLRVAVSQIAPAPRRRAGSIEVWAEPGGARFSSRWRDDSGVLRYALWKPATEQEWVFNPKLSPRIVPVVSSRMAETSLPHISDQGLELEQIEAGYMRWLQSRRWRPIAFASELSSFVNGNGVILHAERFRTSNGDPSIRLSAQRESGGVRTEIVMEVAAGTFLPRLQKIRFRDAGREVELAIEVERAESVAPYQLRPAVFLPDLEATAPPSPVRARITAPVEARKSIVLPAIQEAQSERGALEIEEIEAEYALHRVDACLGEPIEILRDRPGHIQIRGLATTAKRKAELLDALAQLSATYRVGIDIRTVEEASADLPPRATPTSKVTQTSADRLPMQDELQRFFARNAAGDADTRRRISEFTTEAVSTSDRALEHGWALRRLAERYGADRAGALPPHSRLLLEEMLSDHLRALRAQSERTRQMLEPLLALAGGESILHQEAGEPLDPSLNAGVMEAFDTIQRIDGLTQALFAGAGLNGAPVDVAATELRGLFNRMARSLAALDSGVTGDFRAEGLTQNRP